MKYLLMLFVLVGCSSDKEDIFDYNEYHFTCSSTEKIYFISRTHDDYVFKIEVVNYEGKNYTYPISKSYLKKEFNADCSQYDKKRIMFLIDELSKRIQKLEQKIK